MFICIVIFLKDFVSFNFVHKHTFSHTLIHVYSKNYAILALIFEFT